LKAVLLVAAAGGGLPQWSSNAEACRRRAPTTAMSCRERKRRLPWASAGSWINASPDLRQSISIATAIAPVDHLGASQLTAAA